MSGGHFDYYQWQIDEIANSIEDYIYGHSLEEEDIGHYIQDNEIKMKKKNILLRINILYLIVVNIVKKLLKNLRKD